MKSVKVIMAVLAVITVAALIGCASGPKVTVVEMDNKGNAMGDPATPDWIRLYISSGISAVQSQPQFKDRYCIIGEEFGINKQFVLTWADNFSAQQRIGAMLRTTITSKYQAKVDGTASSTGGANSAAAQGESTGDFKQEMDNSINAVVNVSYSGAQREADWWTLRRRYDPDQEGVFADEFTAYVMYTIPKAELNRQIAQALETSVAADSQLYDITIELAREILLEGFEYLGEGETTPVAPVNTTSIQLMDADGTIINAQL
jgi:hypothetical protein